MSSSVTVWPDKRQYGYAPDRDLADVPFHTVYSITDALTRRWSTDAHVVPYYAVNVYTGEREPRCPRVNLGGESGVNDDFRKLVYDSIWFDIDAPKGVKEAGAAAVDSWWLPVLGPAYYATDGVWDKLNNVPAPFPAWYRTRGGGRIIWRIPPTSRADYALLHASFSDVLVAAGIAIDEACSDPTRCYRLPRVMRDDVAQDYPMSCDTIPLLEYTPPPPPAPTAEDDDKARATTRLDQARRRASRSSHPIKGAAGLVDLFEAEGLYIRPHGLKHIVECPWAAEHSSGKYGDTSTVLLPGTDGHIFVCKHAHCVGRSNGAVRERYEDIYDFHRYEPSSRSGGRDGSQEAHSATNNTQTRTVDHFLKGPSAGTLTYGCALPTPIADEIPPPIDDEYFEGCEEDDEWRYELNEPSDYQTESRTIARSVEIGSPGRLSSSTETPACTSGMTFPSTIPLSTTPEWTVTASSLSPTSPDSETSSPLTLEEARKLLAERLKHAFKTPGNHTIRGPTGAGKTFGMLGAAFAAALLESISTTICEPSRELRSEIVRDLEARIAAEGGYKGVVVEEAKGREPGRCSWFDVQDAARRAGGDACAKATCVACPARDSCEVYVDVRRRAMDSSQPDAIITVGTHAMLASRKAIGATKDDVVVIDESPLGTWAPTYSISAEVLCHAAASGALRFNEDGDLLKLVEILWQQERCGGAPILEGLSGPVVVDVEAAQNAAAHALALHGWGGNAQLEELRKMPELGALEALADCSADDWSRTHVLGKRLHVQSRLMTAEDIGAKSLIYLDATCDVDVCEAMGFDAPEPLDVEIPDNVRVIRVPWDAGRRHSEKRMDIAGAIHAYFDDEFTLHLTHKALREGGWAALMKGVVSHFNSSESRGTNKYSKFLRIVLDSWHVPGNAIKQMAATLRGANPDKVGVDWEAKARAKMEQDVLDQLVGRLRANLRPDEQIEVVYCGAPRSFAGLPPVEDHEVVTVPEIYWQQWGQGRYVPALYEWVAELVTVDGWLVWDGDRKVSRSTHSYLKPLVPACQAGILPAYTARALLHKSGLGQRNPAALAAHLGLACTTLKLAINGRLHVRHIIHLPGADLAQAFEAYALSEGADWFKVGDSTDRHYTDGNRMAEAARALEAVDLPCDVQNMSDVLCVAKSTYYAACRQRDVKPRAVERYGSAVLGSTVIAAIATSGRPRHGSRKAASWLST